MRWHSGKGQAPPYPPDCPFLLLCFKLTLAGDVLFYLKGESLFSQRPLFFGDCSSVISPPHTKPWVSPTAEKTLLELCKTLP